MNKIVLVGLAVILATSCGKIKKELRGSPGADGTHGQDAVLEVIDPCGDASGVVDEILLRLSDGSVLCSFSANASGQNTRLAILPPGNYVTTDGSACAFTVTQDGQIQ